jgi:hypothetical protein
VTVGAAANEAALQAREVVVATQFRGPPNSGNGGYVCGLLAEPLGGVVTAVLRAPVPLDTPMRLVVEDAATRLTSLAGELIGEARRADPAELTLPPPPPGLAAAAAAAARFIGLERTFHPICFTCGPVLDEGFGCRVFAGQIEGAEPGFVAADWTPHVNFAGEDGITREEVVWAALDCPGSVAWAVQQGGGGLLGTMTCEVVRRPRAGEACIVTAWPIERSGRKMISGTALFTADGGLLARSRQVWIGRAPVASPE